MIRQIKIATTLSWSAMTMDAMIMTCIGFPPQKKHHEGALQILYICTKKQ